MGKWVLGKKWKKDGQAGIICPCIYAIRSFLFTVLGVEGRGICLICGKENDEGKELTPQTIKVRERRKWQWKAMERTEVFWCEVAWALVRGPPLLFRCTLPRSERRWLRWLFGVLCGLFPYQRAPPLRNHECGARLLSALSVYLNESSF